MGREGLVLEHVAVRYGAAPVVEGVDLALPAGEIGCLLGGSGSGKSTLLRAIAGFEPLAAGSLWLGARQLGGPGLMVPAHLRGVGMVFQDHALFPHLSVAENIGFGLQALGRDERRARVENMLAMVGLAGRGRDYPHQLSGGQQQRVALARALAPGPALILLDEPFASLDSTLRKRLAMEVRELIKRSGTTALLVTHDQDEAFAVADRVGLLAEGRLQQWDSAYALYHQPVNRTVAGFVGEGVLLPGEVIGEFCLRLPLGEFCWRHALPAAPGGRVEVLIRPDDILHDEASPLRARVVERVFRGAEFLYRLELAGGHHVLALLPSHHDLPLGAEIGIQLALDHLVTFP